MIMLISYFQECLKQNDTMFLRKAIGFFVRRIAELSCHLSEETIQLQLLDSLCKAICDRRSEMFYL